MRLRRLALIPALLLAAMALMGPSVAFGASEPTSGYGSTPTTPTTTTSKEPEPTKEPAASAVAPSSESKASTLPFTGFDLRWSLGIGLLLIGAGFSIVIVQRRQRREDS